MMSSPSSIDFNRLFNRVKGFLLAPAQEWKRIDAENDTAVSLFMNYAMILAAIPALTGLIGGVVFGYGVGPSFFRPSIFAAIGSCILRYVLSLAVVYVLGLIVDFMAPIFGGEKNRIQSLKLVVYSATASWVAAVFHLFPPLAMVAVLLGFYGVYLFYTGLPILMKAPQEKAVIYTGTLFVAAFLLFSLAGFVTMPHPPVARMANYAGAPPR